MVELVCSKHLDHCLACSYHYTSLLLIITVIFILCMLLYDIILIIKVSTTWVSAGGRNGSVVCAGSNTISALVSWIIEPKLRLHGRFCREQQERGNKRKERRGSTQGRLYLAGRGFPGKIN